MIILAIMLQLGISDLTIFKSLSVCYLADFLSMLSCTQVRVTSTRYFKLNTGVDLELWDIYGVSPRASILCC
jgi:hypothetical protein